MANDTLNFSIPARWNTLGGMTVTGGELTVSPPNTGGTYVYSYPKDGFFEPIEVGEEYNVSIVVSRHSGAAKNIAVHIYEYATNDESSYLGQSLLAAHSVSGTGTYGPQTYTVGNDGFAEIAIQMPDNDNDWAIDEIIFTPVGAGGQTIVGSLHTDPDAFGGGAVAPGAVGIVGSLHTDPDTFGGGVVTVGSVDIAGQVHTDPDTFPGGAVAPGPVTIAGLLHTDPDTFGGGVVTTGAISIVGSLHTDPDTFPGGAVTPGPVNITGSLHTDPDTFGGGVVSIGFVIVGSFHTDPDTFPGGAVTPGPVTITGSFHTDPDTFPGGVVSVDGTVVIVGSLHSDLDTFPGGVVTTGPVNITGSLHSDPDSFGGGTVDTVFNIAGLLHTDPDTFGGGAITTGIVTIAGLLHSDPDTFPGGIVTGGVVEVVFGNSNGERVAMEISQALLEVAQAVGAGEFLATLITSPVDAVDNPWDTPSVTPPTEVSLRIMQDSWTQFEMTNTLIRSTDKKLMVEAKGIVPTVADRLKIGGVVHEIVNVTPAAYGGVDLFYMVQARA